MASGSCCAKGRVPTRISDLAVALYRQDQSARLDFWGSDVREPYYGRWHPVGELQTEPFQFAFNGFLKVAFQGSRITSDAGLILIRELDERLGLATLISEHLSDSRQGLNTQFGLVDLLRQSVYSRLAGYEDLNDAARVSADPTFRLIGSPTRWDRGAALTSTLHWFETDLLTRGENLLGLMAVNREMLAPAGMPTRAGRIVLDMDSSESPVHGAQEGSAYNGHFASVCYHPLFLFNEHGDCVAATLRPGNVHSATTGTTCSCRKLNDSRRRVRAWRSARTRRSRSRRSTRRLSNATWTMPSACRRTRAWSWTSKTSCFVRRDGRAARPWCGTRVFATGRRAGPHPDGSWPRWSTTAVSCSPVSASS